MQQLAIELLELLFYFFTHVLLVHFFRRLFCWCILNEVCQFNGACPRRGANRAAASGRLRADQPGRAGGCGRSGRAHARTNIQNNSFIIPFISIHLLNNFSSLYILLPSYSRYLLKRERNQLALRKSGEFFRAKFLVKSSSSPDRIFMDIY